MHLYISINRHVHSSGRSEKSSIIVSGRKAFAGRKNQVEIEIGQIGGKRAKNHCKRKAQNNRRQRSTHVWTFSGDDYMNVNFYMQYWNVSEKNIVVFSRRGIPIGKSRRRSTTVPLKICLRWKRWRKGRAFRTTTYRWDWPMSWWKVSNWLFNSQIQSFNIVMMNV